jgi:hypothetical protein
MNSFGNKQRFICLFFTFIISYTTFASENESSNDYFVKKTDNCACNIECNNYFEKFIFVQCGITCLVGGAILIWDAINTGDIDACSKLDCVVSAIELSTGTLIASLGVGCQLWAIKDCYQYKRRFDTIN